MTDLEANSAQTAEVREGKRIASSEAAASAKRILDAAARRIQAETATRKAGR